MRYMTIAAALMFLAGCAVTQKAQLRRGMTFHETKTALNPVIMKYENGKRIEDEITETYIAESWPCWAESFTYTLIYKDGLLDYWTKRETVNGDAIFVCINGEAMISEDIVADAK